MHLLQLRHAQPASLCVVRPNLGHHRAATRPFGRLLARADRQARRACQGGVGQWVLYHLYHGSSQTRDHAQRYTVGNNANRAYNPAEDIFEDPVTGVFRWNCSGAHGCSGMRQGWKAAQRRQEDSMNYPIDDWRRCEYNPVSTELWWASVSKRARERAALPPALPALAIGDQLCMSMDGAAEGTSAPATLSAALAAARHQAKGGGSRPSSTPHAIPQLFMLGAQKAGTTTLHKMLPVWWPETFGKALPLHDEPNFFTKERHAFDSAYDGLMADLQQELSPGMTARSNETRVRHWPCGPKTGAPCTAVLVQGPASLLWRLVRAYPCVTECPQCKRACPNTMADWYKRRPDCVLGRGSFPSPKVAFVDATPNYLADALAPKAMSRLMPRKHPRFLVVVRAPIDRLLSLYKHVVSLLEPTVQADRVYNLSSTTREGRRFLPPRGSAAVWGLAATALGTRSASSPSIWAARLLSSLDACLREPAHNRGPRGEGPPPSLNSCTAESISVVERCLPDTNGLGGGLYAVHVLRWLRFFPAESFSLITFNLLTHWPHLTNNFLAQQWGLPPALLKPMRWLNEKKGISQSFDAVQYAALEAFYQPCNARLLPVLHTAGIHFRVSALDTTFADPLRAYSFWPTAPEWFG